MLGIKIVPGLAFFKAKCDAFLKCENRINLLLLFVVLYQQFFVKKSIYTSARLKITWGFFGFSIYEKSFSSEKGPMLDMTSI